MEAKLLRAEKHTNSETGFLCHLVKSNTERFKPHYHDYYELFLILKGNVLHTVNSTQQILHKGHLLFIRDFDKHHYTSADNNYFEFINIAFKKEYLNAVFDYLGDDFSHSDLLDSALPPMVELALLKTENLFYSFSELVNYNDISVARLKLKVLLINIFSKYFSNYSNTKSAIPLWLEITYEKMKKPQNFVSGLDKMCEISEKTYEHLARSLKKHYGITPTQYITDLRLEYSANLLINSNLSITDICYACGFENTSWFHTVFKKKYNISPGEYRKKYQYIHKTGDGSVSCDI